MRIVLLDHTRAYNLFTLCAAVDPNLGRNVRSLNIEVPDAGQEANNAGVVVKIGRANSSVIASSTDVDPEVTLGAAQSHNFPEDIKNSISLVARDVIASNDNAVLIVSPIAA